MKTITEYINESLLKKVNPIQIKLSEISEQLKPFTEPFTDDIKTCRLVFICDNDKNHDKIIKQIEQLDSFKSDKFQLIDFSDFDTNKLTKSTCKWFNSYGQDLNCIYICDKSEGISDKSFEYVINNIYRSVAYIPDQNKIIKIYNVI